jgi:hypothetical protein
MDIEAVDARFELLELVQAALLRAPVEPLAPVGDELLEILQVRAVVPAGRGDFVGKTRARKTLFQVGEYFIGNMDAKWYDVASRLRIRANCGREQQDERADPVTWALSRLRIRESNARAPL